MNPGYSNLFVCLLGVGTVFVGLICIIVLCKIMGLLCKGFAEKEQKAELQNNAQSNQDSSQDIPNRQEMVAAVSAVIAEQLGKDISAIKILSIKRL